MFHDRATQHYHVRVGPRARRTDLSQTPYQPQKDRNANDLVACSMSMLHIGDHGRALRAAFTGFSECAVPAIPGRFPWPTIMSGIFLFIDAHQRP